MWDSDDWERLGDMVRKRREELGLTQAEVQSLGGPSTASLRAIENKRARSLSVTKRRDLERALYWASGSVEAILDDREPPPSLPADRAIWLAENGLTVEKARDLGITPPGAPEETDGSDTETDSGEQLAKEIREAFTNLTTGVTGLSASLNRMAVQIPRLKHLALASDELTRYAMIVTLAHAGDDAELADAALIKFRDWIDAHKDAGGNIKFTPVRAQAPDAADFIAEQLVDLGEVGRQAVFRVLATKLNEKPEEDSMPAFDPSNLLAAMPEPEGDREPDDEFPADPPNDDFEGR